MISKKNSLLKLAIIMVIITSLTISGCTSSDTKSELSPSENAIPESTPSEPTTAETYLDESPQSTNIPTYTQTIVPTETTQDGHSSQELLNYYTTLENAVAFHDEVFYSWGDPKYDIPYDYTTETLLKQERAKYERLIGNDIYDLKEHIKLLHTEASESNVPEEYTISKLKLIAGIEAYLQGLVYLENSYKDYIDEDKSYNGVETLYYAALDEFDKGDDYFEEAYKQIP